jgi:K+-transporting ATPase ATPase C chain
MHILREVRRAILALAALTLLLGVVYPLAMTGLAQVLFPAQANGSLVVNQQGTVVGSVSIAQGFTKPGYFHPRPSAAGANGYDATASGASNLGPTNPKLVDAVQASATAYRTENQLAPDASVPVDAVTTSGSGLDPEISPANALLQAPRVARARNLPVDQIRTLIDRHTQGRTLGFLGELRVNVLELNLALDREAGAISP